MSEEDAAAKVRRYEMLYRVGLSLTAQQSRDRLAETILLEAKQFTHADGGTLYTRTDDDKLRFEIMRSDTLGIAKGGADGEPIDLPPLPLRDAKTGRPNTSNVATCAAVRRETINIADAYTTKRFDFSGTKRFDEMNDYRSVSFLTIPMLNRDRQVIGVLQLINARDPSTGEIVPFPAEEEEVIEALAAQAGLALDNQLLYEGQKRLLEAFIKLIAAAIDAKSPYTGGHCERVPVLTEMLTSAACESDDAALTNFDLDEDQWYELRIAAWLHDCGKVVTPVHVMDKATKLETIFDRMEVVRARFEVIRRDLQIRRLERIAAGEPAQTVDATFGDEVAQLDDDLAFLEMANVGGEFLAPDKQQRIHEIGARVFTQAGEETRVLSETEVENLCISRGTLTEQERLVINGHMVQTIKMLEALPFPRNLRRVPEYAGGHHEKMDGQGYPKGLFAGDMSVPARIMAIADVFEALTAQDRPYKKGKTLSESMRIMGFMKKDNHLDPVLFDLFVSSGVYRQYAERFLPAEQIDEVDEASLLAIEPKPFELPPESERKSRWAGFLPEYATQADDAIVHVD